MDNIEKEVREIISKVAKIKPEELKEDSNLFQDLGVDSLVGVEIIAAIDKKYSLDIPEEKLEEVQTVKELVNMVKELKK